MKESGKKRTGAVGLALLCALAAAYAAAEESQRSAKTASPPPARASGPSFLRNGTLDIDAAVKHFEDMYRSESSISTAELIVVKPRRTRTMKMNIWTKGEEKALIVIVDPAREKGTATLKVDKNLWNYLPRIKRTIRIPPTNDDLVKESSYREDYTYSVAGRSEEPVGWRVRFDAKPDTVGLWKRFEVVLTEDGTLPLEGRYYDRKDRLSRIIIWSDVKVFDGRLVPARLTLTPQDSDKEGLRTEMVYHDIEFDVDVPDRTFSLSELERAR
jgi:outer membrane lipoprotein-sorting protein